MSVSVLIPVLNRPERVAPLVESLKESVRDVPVTLIFLCTPGDTAEQQAIVDVGLTPAVVGWDAGPADWARKINLGYSMTRDDWIFTGADDLCFCPGWADRALECAAETGAQVIGTNDLGNPRVMKGAHATHNLVSRRYADEHGTIDGRGQVVSEAYDHNFVDDELVETARRRGTWAFCVDSEVPHLHPHWGHGEIDSTYRKGLAGFDRDRRLFMKRRRRITRR